MNRSELKSSLFAISLFTLCATFISCDDVIEKDISDKTITIIAPADSFTSSILTQTFWWEELEGAGSYKVQIVKGNFLDIQQLIADTNVLSDKFTISLLPGNYAWRVRGENNGSFTTYSTHTLTIDSTFDLSNQVINLVSPSDLFETNQQNITFHWSSLYNADSYRIQIIDQSTNSLIFDSLTSLNSLSKTIYEGAFTWKVRGENDLSFSQYSERTVIVDLTAPDPPYNLLPSAGTLLNTSDTLYWSVDPNSVSDSLYLYADTTTNSPNKVFCSTSYFVLTGQLPKTYYWKVNSTDAAGNTSQFSNTSKFVLQ